MGTANNNRQIRIFFLDISGDFAAESKFRGNTTETYQPGLKIQEIMLNKRQVFSTDYSAEHKQPGIMALFFQY
jgi:hypothetical protein